MEGSLLALVAVSLKYGKHTSSNPVKNDNRKRKSGLLTRSLTFFPEDTGTSVVVELFPIDFMNIILE